MLAKLTVKNVALIERAEISFSEGLNVLSGETGAGKSVILDSLNFVLGAKADKSMIRYGETECMVKAEFVLPETSKAIVTLREMDIDSDGELIISRRFSENGKNSIKINGNTVTAAMLRKVTDSVVDVHGQSEHFFLLKESNQLKTLDGVIGGELTPKKEKLSELIAEKKRLETQIGLLGGDEQERGRTLDILKFQIDEIKSVALQEGEEEELTAKKNKINNLERLISSLQEAVSALSDEGGALDSVRVAKRAVSSIVRLDEEYEKTFERMEALAMEAEDIAETLSDLGDELYFDENEAEEIENRLDAIKALKKKYGTTATEINAFLASAEEKFELLSDCEGKYAALTEQKAETAKDIYKVCKQITAIRQKHGEEFCRKVTDELKTLNIPNAAFSIDFQDYTPEDAERATANGLDDICFLFSANAGEPVKPLGKIISGGEMSRFMLAIKTRLSDLNGISTYLFDEIDAGISGKTAKVVGEKFAKIAKNTQIIAVSHLAQIASMSDREFLIEKREENGKTHTTIRQLDEREHICEIVRLLGGDETDEFARKHAEELVKQAKEYKFSLL
ncbi:MAG: DNA repair protein RecN [Clostridia bacterium]|nr:DNA repair protein RecN [Clostridia bacterium]